MMITVMMKMSDKDVIIGHVVAFDGFVDSIVFVFFGITHPTDWCTI